MKEVKEGKRNGMFDTFQVCLTTSLFGNSIEIAFRMDLFCTLTHNTLT